MNAASAASTGRDRAPVVQSAGVGQAAVTLGNTDGEIGGLSIGIAYSQAEVQTLRDKCEELADDVRAEAAPVHALRAALVEVANSDCSIGITNRVERCFELGQASGWQKVFTFVSTATSTNWSETTSAAFAQAFYRVTSQVAP